ncbi:hypothetical protein GGF40_004347 [Coemansia sp. RSA 1286]|nr:hypothetical protein GGF40_004347 [Coemansia sp. RSA 1286]
MALSVPNPADNSRKNIGKQRRKKKSRADKLAADEQRSSKLASLISDTNKSNDLENVTIEYVAPQQLELDNPALAEFSEVFSHFAKNAARSFGATTSDGEDSRADDMLDADKKKPTEPVAMDSDEDVDMDSVGSDEDESSSDGDDSGNRGGKLSRKQKKQNRITLAELKQLAPRPEVVEWTDTSAHDPLLLVTLKGQRNTVPVPMHWGQKKKYLQYKRGLEKPAFDLPDFIKATGIMEMRESIQETADAQTAKTTARDRMRPKMNKLTLDYQRLHDAFFRFQTRPSRLAEHGDLFYEGKENDSTFHGAAPGVLSEELRKALSIPPLAPPPWLLNMQRYGPPPSYPNMVVPGLNAPIPPGAQWGFHPGGWGRPPVDEFGRPLYGDVFVAHDSAAAPSIQPGSAAQPAATAAAAAVTGPKKYWGDLEAASSSDEEDDDDEEESDNSDDEEMQQGPSDTEQHKQPATRVSNHDIASNIASIPSGLETPSVLQLRKQTAISDTAERTSLYKVLPEQATAKLEGIMGSQFTYDMTSALDPSKQATNKTQQTTGKRIDIALDASELENMDQEALRAKYDEAAYGVGESRSRNHEDLSDMVADHAAAQAKKRKNADNVSTRKKAKDFKF